MPKLYDKLKKINSSTLIAAAGTGAALLFKQGIETHFNAILDASPNKEYTPYYNTHSGALFYLLRSGAHGVMQHQGLKILCASSTADEFIKSLIDPSLSDPDYFINYWTVTDFLLSQLLYLGCGPIYLCGADHILKDNRYYGDPTLNETAITGLTKMLITLKNIHGDEVLSKFDWVQGSKAISKLAKAYPQTPIFYVSDEGLPIEGVQVMSTEAFNNLEFDTAMCSEDLYLPTLLNSPTTLIDDSKIIEYLDKNLESLAQCQELFSQTDIALGKLYAVWQLIPIDDLNPYTGIFFELQQKLNEQMAYTHLLEPTWRMFKSQMHTDAGFFEDPTKIKLTLFALKVRELDFYKNNTRIFHTLFNLQKNQIIERMESVNSPIASPDILHDQAADLYQPCP